MSHSDMAAGRTRRGGAAVALAALLSACASVPPAPLARDVDAALRGPDLAALTRDAATLDHPILRPVVIDPARPLTPDALAVLSVIANPELKAARARAKVTQAQAFDAGLLPDPTVALGFDKLLSGPDMIDSWSRQLTQDLVALRDRAAIKARDRAAAQQVRLDLAWQEWQTAGQARLLAARTLGLARATALNETSLAKADVMLTRVVAAAARGDVKADEVETRRLAAVDAADKAVVSRRDWDTARHALNALLGLAPETLLPLAVAPNSPQPLDAAALFARARAERLDLKALESGYDSQNAAVRKAVLDRMNSLQLMLGRSNDTTGNRLFNSQVSFSLPLWNAGRGGVKVALATRDQLRAEYVARVLATRSDIAELVSRLTLEAREREAVQRQLDALRPLADAAAAAAQRGDVSLAAAETARQAVADKSLLLAGLEQSMAEQQTALQIAVGGPL